MKKLNIKELTKNSKTISTEEALKDVVPFQWSEEVLSGKAKVIISSKKK